MKFFTEPTLSTTDEVTTGVLLINIGAPEALSKKAVKSYLFRFLSDKRVIEISSWWWKGLLKFIILPRYKLKSFKKYQMIWPAEQNDSPLLHNSQNLERALQKKLNESATQFVVKAAMNYSSPDVTETILQFKQQGIKNLIIIPLFPQYSATTTAASLDKVYQIFLKLRVQPEISTISQFADNPIYLDCLAEHIRNYWKINGRADKLLFSFHGIPVNYVQNGDPYYQQCLATVLQIATRLQLNDNDYITCFQSKFGGGKWLSPSLHETLLDLSNHKISSIDVIAPSFVVDCLETLEEINITSRQTFLQAGGTEFNYIPCLNFEEKWLSALTKIILNKNNFK